MHDEADIAVVGAGAAGLMAAIWAGRTASASGKPRRIVALDGAKVLGAKILVAGGGRCNVTHDEVDESSYNGSTRPAIRNVLRAFGVPRTIAFFRELGVELKREDTGKLFPTTDDAHTVLDALLAEARRLGVELRHPWRVASITRREDGSFLLHRRADDAVPAQPPLTARALVLAPGGMALPRSGSDGSGYDLARSLGHSVTARVFPALVPLLLPEGHPLRALQGIAAPVRLTVQAATGKRIASVDGPLLCTHFGISGPAPLDISRHLTAARHADPGASLVVNWLPGLSVEQIDERLAGLRTSAPGRWLTTCGLAERLARAICASVGVDPTAGAEHLTRARRRELAHALGAMPLPVSGDRGFTFAEVTAGGVPLAELRLDSMASRVCPGLYIAGELLDVDGRIGGYNFQWAWASGHLAGCAAANSPALSP